MSGQFSDPLAGKLLLTLIPSPFRFQLSVMLLGLGTDIVEIDRIRSMMQRHGSHFIDRCFTPGEIEYSQKHRDAAVRFAGRWAAKEAIVKVLGTGFVQGITFHDIEIVSLHTGQPTVKLSGEAGRIAQSIGIQTIQITISHAREYATATAIGVGPATS